MKIVGGVLEHTHSVPQDQIEWNFLVVIEVELKMLKQYLVNKIQANHMNCFQIYNWELSTL